MLGTERREGGKAVGRQPRGERLCPSVVSAYLCTLSPSRDIDSLSQESERKGEDAKKASTTEAAFGRFAVFLLCACYSRLSLSLSLLEFVAQSAHFVRVPTPRTGAFIGDHHGLRPAPISVRTAALLLHSHYQSLRRIRPPLARKRTNQSVSQLQLNYAILSLLMRF